MIVDAITLTIPKLPRVSLRFLVILSSLTILFLLAGYIFQVNEVTQAGFMLTGYEKNLSELIQAKKSLELNYSQTSSLVNLETILMNLNYEKVEEIHYLRVPGSTVVAK
jgi:hypothetical protein